MKPSQIPAIDALLTAGTGGPIGPGFDPEAVGAVQDLLRGQGFSRMPGLRDKSRGVFGKGTTRAVATFRRDQGLPDGGTVDQDTLAQLVQVPAIVPIVSQAYVTLVLDFDFDKFVKLVSLVAIVEGAGKFAALCLNTDHAGLSVGIIQWAQKPKRLHELIDACNTAQPDATLRAFGGQANVDGVLAHTDLGKGGLNDDGSSADPVHFDLIRDPWKARFKAACLDPPLQAVQVDTAVADFKASFANIQAKMPKITSERQVAFTIDLANQFGNGGAKSIYDQAVAGLADPNDPAELLGGMRDISVAKLAAKFPKLPQVARAGADRRDFFIETPLLVDTAF